MVFTPLYLVHINQLNGGSGKDGTSRLLVNFSNLVSQQSILFYGPFRVRKQLVLYLRNKWYLVTSRTIYLQRAKLRQLSYIYIYLLIALNVFSLHQEFQLNHCSIHFCSPNL